MLNQKPDFNSENMDITLVKKVFFANNDELQKIDPIVWSSVKGAINILSQPAESEEKSKLIKALQDTKDEKKGEFKAIRPEEKENDEHYALRVTGVLLAKAILIIVNAGEKGEAELLKGQWRFVANIARQVLLGNNKELNELIKKELKETKKLKELKIDEDKEKNAYEINLLFLFKTLSLAERQNTIQKLTDIQSLINLIKGERKEKGPEKFMEQELASLYAQLIIETTNPQLTVTDSENLSADMRESLNEAINLAKDENGLVYQKLLTQNKLSNNTEPEEMFKKIEQQLRNAAELLEKKLKNKQKSQDPKKTEERSEKKIEEESEEESEEKSANDVEEQEKKLPQETSPVVPKNAETHPVQLDIKPQTGNSVGGYEPTPNPFGGILFDEFIQWLQDPEYREDKNYQTLSYNLNKIKELKLPSKGYSVNRAQTDNTGKLVAKCEFNAYSSPNGVYLDHITTMDRSKENITELATILSAQLKQGQKITITYIFGDAKPELSETEKAKKMTEIKKIFAEKSKGQITIEFEADKKQSLAPVPSVPIDAQKNTVNPPISSSLPLTEETEKNQELRA